MVTTTSYNFQLESREEERPVPVSSSSSLDSFALAVTLPGGDCGGANTVTDSEKMEESSVTDSHQESPPVVEERKSFLPPAVPPGPAPGMIPSSIMGISPASQPSSLQTAMQSSLLAGNMLFPGSHATGNSVPEFLYQLTKMLTEDNREVIEWSNGLIKVHNPLKLESHVLHKYFRHSKFSSFQRQLNYFGFRKLAGKGKMAPCSYANESAGQDIGSLLFIKRKSSATSAKDKAGLKKDGKGRPQVSSKSGVNPVLAGILHRSTHTPAPPKSSTQHAIAQSAVGKGIRHSFVSAPKVATAAETTVSLAASPVAHVSSDTLPPDPLRLPDNLSLLATNFHNSLNDLRAATNEGGEAPTPMVGGFLSRDSSLIDLAMIPVVEDANNEAAKAGHGELPAPAAAASTEDSVGWNFVDFPHPEVNPTTTAAANQNGKTEGSS